LIPTSSIPVLCFCFSCAFRVNPEKWIQHMLGLSSEIPELVYRYRCTVWIYIGCVGDSRSVWYKEPNWMVCKLLWLNCRAFSQSSFENNTCEEGVGSTPTSSMPRTQVQGLFFLASGLIPNPNTSTPMKLFFNDFEFQTLVMLIVSVEF
jgi:hypothetical protein